MEYQISCRFYIEIPSQKCIHMLSLKKLIAVQVYYLELKPDISTSVPHPHHLLYGIIY